MSSEQGNSNATWGEGTNDRKQVQQNDPSTTTQTSGKRGGSITPSGPAEPPQPQNTRSFKQKFNQFKQKFLQFVDHFSYIVVPLTFAILIFFITLLIAMHEHIFLPPLPLAILLLALAVMQGALLYFVSTSGNTSSKDTYWNLIVIIGFALFLIVGALAVFGFGASVFLLIILLLVGVFLASRCIHQVPEGSIDIVNMFGKYVRTLQPGLHLLMPWEKSGDRLNTKETPWKSPEQGVKISQNREVKLVAKIWYQLDPEKAHIADLKVVNWETSLQEKFMTTLKNVFRELHPADINSWQQGTQGQISQAQTLVDINTIDASTKTPLDRINDMIVIRVQQDVNDWGVNVRKVSIEDLTLIPNLAPRGNPIIRSIGPAQVVAGPTSGGNPVVAQPQQEQMTINSAVDQQSTMPVPPSSASGYSLPSASEIEMLKESFEAIRAGRVRDPQTIRNIASRFEAHIYDPYVDFYPLGAAEILYRRARLYELENDQKSRARETVPETGKVEKDRTNTNVIVNEEQGRTSVTFNEEKNGASVTVSFVVQPDRIVTGQANDYKYSGG